MEYEFQIQNIKFQIKSIESQFDNVEIQIKSIGTFGIGTQIKNIGIQLLNLGIQALNIGNQMPANMMSIIDSNKFEQEIKNISTKLVELSNPMEQMNMTGMDMNDMGNNRMGMSMNDNIQMQMQQMAQMQQMVQQMAQNQQKRKNFIFEKSNGNKRSISCRYGKTVDELLKKYLNEEGKMDLIDKDTIIDLIGDFVSNFPTHM